MNSTQFRSRPATPRISRGWRSRIDSYTLWAFNPQSHLHRRARNAR